MLKYCLRKWEENKSALENDLRRDMTMNSCSYLDLVKKVTDIILNGGEEEEEKWNAERITEINDGDYQGTLIFLIPRGRWQPTEYDYLMTYVGYGSCSGCDILESIQDWGDKQLTEEQVDDFMTLCRHLVCSMVKPYNNGWRNEEEFEEVREEMDSSDNCECSEEEIADKLLIVQALETRDRLAEKIRSRIQTASFTDIAQKNQELVTDAQISRDEFKKRAEESYLQILELIQLYQKIDTAITISDATTYIKTSFGTFSVAEALSLKQRYERRNVKADERSMDFELCLYAKIQIVYERCLDKMEKENKILRKTAEEMSVSTLERSGGENETKRLESVECFVTENEVELVDPLGIKKKAAVLDEKTYMLMQEIRNGIWLSNMVTVIEL